MTGFYEATAEAWDERVIEKAVAGFAMAAGAVLLAKTFSRQCADDTQHTP